MTNETTASQPKSIGDDAQFHQLLKAYADAPRDPAVQMDRDAGWAAFKELRNYIDSRAPAAQAYATIQAAPDVGALTEQSEAWLAVCEALTKAVPGWQSVANTGMASAVETIRRLAATIKEPVMVAEPLRKELAEKVLCGECEGNGKGTCNDCNGMGFHWEPIEAAPMVADPAGVVLVAFHDELNRITWEGEDEGWNLAITAVQKRLRALIEASKSAATVKAVASEAMPATQEPKYGIRCNRLFNRASGEFIPADEPVFIFRARDFHAADAIGWYAGGVTNFEHYRAVSDRVMQFRAFADKFPSRMKEPDTANFAAPLADKTGGGE